MGSGALQKIKTAAIIIHVFLVIGETVNDILQTTNNTLFDTPYNAILAFITLVVNVGFLLVAGKISPYIHYGSSSTVVGKVFYLFCKSHHVGRKSSSCNCIGLLGNAHCATN